MDIKIENDIDVAPTEIMFETVELPTPCKNIAIWSNKETKQLMELYKSFIMEVGPEKRFRRKKDMWSEISTHISTDISFKSSKQCLERFKTCLRRKRKGVKESSTTGDKKKKYDSEAEVETDFEIIEKLKGEYETDDSSAPFKQVQLWTDGESKQLIELYKRLINDVGPMKRFKRKLDMWSEISLQIGNKTSKQCEERFKTVLRRKRKDNEMAFISQAESENENTYQIIRNHKKYYEDVKNIPPFKNVRIWSSNETKRLMELYRRFILEVGPEKRFLHKKDMWVEISSNFTNKDPKQCQQRYNTIKRKKNLANLYRLKARRRSIDFRAKNRFETHFKIRKIHTLQNEKFISDKETIAPEKNKLSYTQEGKLTTTSNGEELSAQGTHSVSPQDKEELTISNTLFKIAAMREEAKERRHKEKMETMKNMQNILQQILDSKK